jgi:beta-glucosidase
VALASGVLLKNDESFLPLERDVEVAVIGELANTPRCQGSSSSQVTPTNLTCLLDGVKESTNKINYSVGYTLQDQANDRLLDEAVNLAAASKVAILCLGLTDIK